MRTIRWQSPRGDWRTVTFGGRREQPLPSVRTQRMEALDTFMERQQERVARFLQQRVIDAAVRRNDGMARTHINTETQIERRG